MFVMKNFKDKVEVKELIQEHPSCPLLDSFLRNLWGSLVYEYRYMD